MTRKKNAEAVMSCLAYSFCSCSMVLSNKALASMFDSNFPFLLIVCQCAVSVLMVEISRYNALIEPYSISLKLALQWLPLNILFCMMLFTSFMALKWMSVHLVTVFKNLTNVIIVLGDWLLYNEAASILTIISLAFMIFGALLATSNDAVTGGWGYWWMCLNCICTASYVLYMRYATIKVKLSKFGMIFYNNLLGMCLLIPASIICGEINEAYRRKNLWVSISFLLLNGIAGIVGFCLNFASLWCVGATTATTYAIIGTVNKVPLMVLSSILFQSPISAKNIIFITMNLFGGLLYSWSMLKKSEKNASKIGNGVQLQSKSTSV